MDDAFKKQAIERLRTNSEGYLRLLDRVTAQHCLTFLPFTSKSIEELANHFIRVVMEYFICHMQLLGQTQTQAETIFRSPGTTINVTMFRKPKTTYSLAIFASRYALELDPAAVCPLPEGIFYEILCYLQTKNYLRIYDSVTISTISTSAIAYQNNSLNPLV